MDQINSQFVDEKIKSFAENNPNLALHNLYYIASVDKDSNITDEKYGANLVTNYGVTFYSYHGNIYNHAAWKHNFLAYNFNINIGSGTATPELTDTALSEYIGTNASWTDDINTDITNVKYNSTKNVLYDSVRVGYGTFDYNVPLPQGDIEQFPGHTGGDTDTRWITDEDDRVYFEITEIGIGTYNNLSMKFLIVDENGNLSSIRKYNNEKLFVYIYHTRVMNCTVMLNEMKKGNYLMFNFVGQQRPMSWNSYGTQYTNYGAFGLGCYTRINNRHTLSWYRSPNSGEQFPKIEINDSDYQYNQDLSCPIYERSISNTLTTDGLYTMNLVNSPVRMAEDWRVYYNGAFLNGDWYNQSYPGRRRWGPPSNEHCFEMLKYESLPTEQSFVCDHLYTNADNSLYINGQFGVKHDANACTGLLSFTHMESVTGFKMFNVQDNDFTIDSTLDFDKNFYNEDTLFLRTYVDNFVCPDDKPRTIYAIFNWTCTDKNDGYGPGFRPNLNIKSINNSGIVLYYTDTWWDVSTWTLVEDMSNLTATERNARYFVTYTDTNLSISFVDSQYPKVVTSKPMKVITDTGYTPTFVRPLSSTSGKFVNLGNTVMKLNTDHSLNLMIDHNLSFDYIASNAYGNRLFGKYNSTSGFVNVVDVNAITANTSADIYANTRCCPVSIFQPEQYGLESLYESNDGRYFSIEVGNTDKTGISVYDSQSTFSNTDLESDIDLTDSSLWENVSNTSYHPVNCKDVYNIQQVGLTEVTPGKLYKISGYATSAIYSSYRNLNACATVYDSNQEQIEDVVIQCTYGNYIYIPANSNIKYIKLMLGVPSTNNYDQYRMYVDRIESCIIKVSKPLTPIFSDEDGKHGFFVRGTNKFIYTKSSTDYLTKWYVVDSTNPSATPTEIDIPNEYIGSQGFQAAMGFAHYAYFSLYNDGVSKFIVVMYDLDAGTLSSDSEWTGSIFKNSSGLREYQIIGNDRCLVYIRTAQDTSGAIYCIPEDEPFAQYKLFGFGNLQDNRLQLEYINDGKQLMLGMCCAYNNNAYRSYVRPSVVDLGYWLKNKTWHERANLTSRLSRGSGSSSTTCHPLEFIYDNGVIEINTSSKFYIDSHELIWKPIECYVPFKLTGTTKCITAYTNPFTIKPPDVGFSITNDMTKFGLNNSGQILR